MTGMDFFTHYALEKETPGGRPPSVSREPRPAVVARRRLGGLHHQDALQGAALQQRHAQEGAIAILARLGAVLEALVAEGVGDHDRGKHSLGMP